MSSLVKFIGACLEVKWGSLLKIWGVQVNFNFFSYHKLRQIWWESLSWINMAGPFAQHPGQNFLQHSFCSTYLAIKSQRWLIWWVALTWCVWNHRNQTIFSNDSFNANKILDGAIFFCWSWLRNLEKGFDNPFHQWSPYQSRVL